MLLSNALSRTRLLPWGIGLTAGFLLSALAMTKAQAGPPHGYTLTWKEEFNQKVGAVPDRKIWNYDLGGGGWGNGEAETYVNDVEHAHIVADSGAQHGKALQILVTRDKEGHYTSARLKTQGKFDVQYGYIEARIKLPYGQGIWPAFWMLGSDVGTVGWPNCGEIDILENIGREPTVIHGSLHGPDYSGGKPLTALFTLPDGKQLKDAYHTVALLWEPNLITFYFDGKAYETRTASEVKTWAFNHPFFFILNVAVGGNWPGSPDSTTQFPQKMLVNYIRVYKKKQA